jgi:hypothetical protein
MSFGLILARGSGEDVLRDTPGDVERGFEKLALRRIDQPAARHWSVICSATARAAMMNISSVTRIASVA